MRWLIIVLASLSIVGSAGAEDVLREVAWSELEQAGIELPGTVLPADEDTAFDRLVVEKSDNEAATMHLASITDLTTLGRYFSLRGRVKCESVEGQAYLEMILYLPDGRRPYSRLLADAGMVRSLEGSSDWRWFMLPFDFGAQAPPQVQRIDLNLIMPGRGRVSIGPVSLLRFDDRAAMFAAPGAWWSDRSAGLIGGVGGALIGCMGALIGVLGSRGRAKRLVVTLMRLQIGFGVVSLIFGIAALILGQPYSVYYPLLLLGVICTVVPAGLLPGIRRRYQQEELRRMDAVDAA